MKSKLKSLKPLFIICVALVLVTIIYYPMTHLAAKNIPMAIVSLDQTVESASGDVNMGEQILGQVAGAESETLDWNILEDEDAVYEMLEDGDLYAAFIIPEEYTASAIAAQAGTGEAAPVKLIINQGKNPTIASTLESSLASMAEAAGLSYETEYYNAVPAEYGSMGAMLPILMTTGTYLVSMFTAQACSRMFRQRRQAAGGYKTGILQAVYLAVLSFVVGFAVTGVLTLIAGASLPFVNCGIFLSLCSMAFMFLIVGASNLFPKFGMLIPVGVFMLGVGTLQGTYEFLPRLWQLLIYPWEPVRFWVEGNRAILYQGAGWWNTSAAAMLIVFAIGIVMFAVSVYRSEKEVRTGTQGITAKEWNSAANHA